MEKECDIWLVHPEYKRILQANNVIRGCCPAHFSSFISKSLRAHSKLVWWHSRLRKSHGHLQHIYMCESWIWWSHFWAKPTWKQWKGWLLGFRWEWGEKLALGTGKLGDLTDSAQGAILDSSSSTLLIR